MLRKRSTCQLQELTTDLTIEKDKIGNTIVGQKSLFAIGPYRVLMEHDHHFCDRVETLASESYLLLSYLVGCGQ